MSCKTKEMEDHRRGLSKSALFMRSKILNHNKKENDGPKEKPETEPEKIKLKKKKGDKRVPRYMRDQDAA